MNPLFLLGVQAIKHSLWRTVSVVCVLLVIAGLSLAVYFAFIRPTTKPNPSNTQQGQRDNYNVSIAPKQTFFGCMRFNIPKPEIKK